MAAAEGVRVTSVIAPSLLSCDFAILAEEAARMERCGADWLHLDVMDGHFVPNLTFGPPVLKCLRKHTSAFFDCHCMIEAPHTYVDSLAALGADQMTFHYEAVEEGGVPALIESIKSAGMRAACAIKPGTPVDVLMPFADTLDMALVMTVEPGFGGQSFMADMMPKVAALRSAFPSLDIEVDGGLSPKTVDAASAAGANVIVAGSAIFKSVDPTATIAALRKSVTDAFARGEGEREAEAEVAAEEEEEE